MKYGARDRQWDGWSADELSRQRRGVPGKSSRVKHDYATASPGGSRPAVSGPQAYVRPQPLPGYADVFGGLLNSSESGISHEPNHGQDKKTDDEHALHTHVQQPASLAMSGGRDRRGPARVSGDRTLDADARDELYADADDIAATHHADAAGVYRMLVRKRNQPAPGRSSTAHRAYGDTESKGTAPTRSDSTFDRATDGSAQQVPYRSEMETRFGASFAEVEAFTGKTELGHVGANAAAKGNKVAFVSDGPAMPQVAHELAHVLQQRQHGITAEAASRDVSDVSDAAEREADAAAASVAKHGAQGPQIRVSTAPTARLHLDRGDNTTGANRTGPKPDAVASLRVAVPRESLIVPAFMTERQVPISCIATAPLPKHSLPHTLMWSLSSPPPLRAQQGSTTWAAGTTSPPPFSVSLAPGEHLLRVSVCDPQEELRTLTRTIKVVAAPDASGDARRKSAAVLGSTLSSSDLQSSIASLRTEVTKPMPEAYDPGAGARQKAQRDLAGLEYAAHLRGERPKPPPAGDETLSFEDQTLSKRPEYTRYVLEQKMAGGTERARAFVERFERYFVTNRAANRNKAERLATNARTEPGGIPGGVPLQPQVVDNLADDSTLAPEILTVLQAQLAILETENQAFRAEFRQRAVELTRAQLDRSEQVVKQEMARYGMTANRDRGLGGASGNEYLADTQAMRAAAKTLLDSRRTMDTAAAKLEQSRFSPTGFQGLPRRKEEDPVSRLAYERAREDHETLRKGIVTRFPALARYRTASQLEEVATARNELALRKIAWDLDGNLINIKKTRENLGDDLDVMRLGPMVSAARRDLLVVPGSARDRVVTEMVKAAAPSALESVAVTVLALAIAGGLALLSGGTSLPATLGIAGLELMGAATDIFLASESVHDSNVEAAARGTDPDQAHIVLQGESPSQLWLAMNLLAAGLSVTSAIKVFAQLNNARKLAIASATAGELTERLGEIEKLATEAGLGEDSVRRAVQQALEDHSDESVRELVRIQMAGGASPWTEDLSHVTGKTARSRNAAIDALVKEDLSDLALTHHPAYSPFAELGVASEGKGTQIGKRNFSSRNKLRRAIVHEELHHRWWKRGKTGYHHSPDTYIPDEHFYKVINRYMRFRGWE